MSARHDSQLAERISLVRALVVWTILFALAFVLLPLKLFQNGIAENSVLKEVNLIRIVQTVMSYIYVYVYATVFPFPLCNTFSKWHMFKSCARLQGTRCKFCFVDLTSFIHTHTFWVYIESTYIYKYIVYVYVLVKKNTSTLLLISYYYHLIKIKYAILNLHCEEEKWPNQSLSLLSVLQKDCVYL